MAQLVLKIPGMSIGSSVTSIPPEVAMGASAGFYKLGLEDRRRVLKVTAGRLRVNLVVDMWASWCAPCMEEVAHAW